jgi:acetylxylan esterase
MFPGYTGYRPRLQLWHGTADTTININNQTQAILEWTNVLGLNATPNSTDTTSVSGFKIEKWQNSCGFTVLEAHTQQNGVHTTPIDANSVIHFFGLTQVTGPDPQVAACDGGVSGSSGATDGGGAGASSSGGGSSSGSSGGGSGSGSGSGAGIGSSTGSSGGNPGSTSGSSGSSPAGSGGSGATGGSSSGPVSGGGSNGSTGSSGGAGASGSSSGDGTGFNEAPSKGSGCGVSPGTASTTDGAMAAAGLLGIALLGRRRRRG